MGDEWRTQRLSEILQILFPDPSNCPTFVVNILSLFSNGFVFINFSKLVGHSMGGSVAVRSCPGLIQKRYRIAGVVVLDVVEGSYMHSELFFFFLTIYR